MFRELANKITLLQERAKMLAEVRAFFAARDVIEVDCPILSKYASVDAAIDLIEAEALNEKHYLHTSPEYGMKRLLSLGMGDIYQLSHVFREGEVGWKHLPEFMMIEWYRLGFTLDQLIDETVALALLFIKKSKKKCEKMSYQQAFIIFSETDPFNASEKDLLDVLKRKKISLSSDQLKSGKEDLLNLVWGNVIEPQLGKEGFVVITNYPKEQAALAKLTSDGQTAYRFELYYDTFELANGYYELADPIEQKKRIEEENRERAALSKKTLPHDPNFIQALERGLPDCCGVAMGFDRLMMLRCEATAIDQVVPFSWDQQ